MIGVSRLNTYGFKGYIFEVVEGGRLDTLLLYMRVESPKLKFFWKFLHYAVLVVTIGFNRRFLNGFCQEEYRSWRVKQFTGPNYDWAWLFKRIAGV